MKIMKTNYFILLLVMSFLLFGCATDSDKVGTVIGAAAIGGDTNPQQPADNKPTINQLLDNKQSMTGQLEDLDSDLTVDVLYSGVENKKFERIVSLNLADEPVLIGVSQARQSSPYFVNILKNANTTPIGMVLFAPNSQIRRDDMQVETIHLSSIKDIIVKEYLSELGYNYDTHIYKRVSTFRYKKQSMQLIEYILPSINQFLD